MQLVKGNKILVNTASVNKLYLVGTYTNESIKVYDEQQQLLLTIPLNTSTQSMYDIFHEVDLSVLSPNKKYELRSSTPVTGLLRDGNAASIELNTHAEKVFYADAPLGFEVKLSNWASSIATTQVKGYLNRNMDAQGNVLHDKLIPVTFEYDDSQQAFVCKDRLELPEGVYSLSVFAEGGEIKRFAATSILMKQSREVSSFDTGDWTVFPNPADDVLTVQFAAAGQKNARIELYDMTGRLLWQQQSLLTEGMQQLRVSTRALALPKGVYMLSMSMDDHRKGSKVIVVN